MFRIFSILPLVALASATVAQKLPSPAPSSPTPSGLARTNARVTAPLPADQAAMKAHVMFLASDAMRGREAGSPEYDIAAQYVAAQFYAAGLRPGGDAGGYLQAVPLVAYRNASEGTLAWNGANLAFGRDFVPVANPAKAATTVGAPVVFVGYGIVRPGRDDYRGVDVRGKIVAVVDTVPSGLSGEERAFFNSATNKAALAGARGAIGVITIPVPKAEAKKPFSAKDYKTPRTTWAKPDGTGHLDTPTTPVLAKLSVAGAVKLLGSNWRAIARAANRAKADFRAIDLGGTLSIATTTSFAALKSSNVIGVIPGSDPKLARETVVLSAHLDHVGVGKPVNGDTIYNGALDDAIGIASLIEEAKRFRTAAPPRRTILFLAVTAEEKGLVGSSYYVNHPTVPIGDIVADVNLDMPILTYKFEDIVAFGGDRSTLGPVIARAVAAAGVELSPDPIPEQGIFVRSDHFRFVQKGIPSVFLWPGHKGPGKAATTEFLATRYHKPSDDLSQPIDWSQGPRFVDINYRVAREIADADTRPVWNAGDYFGTLFNGPMAR